jgi:NAD(P)-dependent dehydrogenase (short-subunit alcohol dehydrogenase family)
MSRHRWRPFDAVSCLSSGDEQRIENRPKYILREFSDGAYTPEEARRLISPDPLLNSFGYRSTAEEVTAGLDLTGKTALISGCNTGIGYETMRVLVMRGAHVYGLARNMNKAEHACAQVTGPAVKGHATPFVCDHTDFSSVVACADAVQRLEAPIDVLICSAGVYFIPTLELAHGIEKHFVVNHLSHFILVNRLIKLVKSVPQGRIVVVGSDAGYLHNLPPAAGIDFDNLDGQRYYDAGKMYGQSKLANALFSRELAHRLSDTGVTANVVHPGMVMTDTMRELVRERSIDPQRLHTFKTPAEGAATPCYVATHPALARISGEYFADCNIVTPGGHMRDDALAKKLWQVSEELTHNYLNVRS